MSLATRPVHTWNGADDLRNTVRRQDSQPSDLPPGGRMKSDHACITGRRFSSRSSCAYAVTVFEPSPRLKRSSMPSAAREAFNNVPASKVS